MVWLVLAFCFAILGAAVIAAVIKCAYAAGWNDATFEESRRRANPGNPPDPTRSYFV